MLFRGDGDKVSKKKNEKNLTDIEGFFTGKNSVKTYPVKKRHSLAVFFDLTRVIAISMIAGLILTIMPTAALSVGMIGAESGVDLWRSLPEEMDEVSIAERNILYDINGDVFAQVWAEDRVALESLDQISDHAKNGLIATEDKRFYEHSGIDYIGTARSALSGSGGGSGITQQLVKNLQFYNMAGKDKKASAVEETYGRKLRELKLSFNYEETHTKDEILLQYFNTVAFGAPNIYSIESASQYFFGKSAKDLNLAESAALVGTVQNPSVMNMNEDSQFDLWKSRQKAVLDRMVAEGFITKDEAKSAAEQELKLVRKKVSYGNCASSKYPSYCQYVLDYLSKSPRLGETQEERDTILAKGGLHIKTYMNPKTMDRINEELSNSFGNDYRIVAPASVVQPGTGGVLGFGVNREYGEGEGKTTLNLANTPVGVGSTYKPFVLAAALENGISEKSMVYDTPCPYKPQGFDYPGRGFVNSQGCGGKQDEKLNFKEATAWSSNTWYIHLATQTGIPSIREMSNNLGLNVPDSISDRSLSFALGAVENTTIDMSAAYASFSNGGIYCPPTPVTSYAYADGSSPAVPDTYDPASDSCRRAMSPHTASVVLQALRANTYEGEGINNPYGRSGRIEGYDAVGKSGTNERYSYSWGQVSSDYALFINIFDMERLTNEVYGQTRWRGIVRSTNPAPEAGSEVLRKVAEGTRSKPLDYNNPDKSFEPVQIEKRDYFTIPSTLGQTPEEAMKTMESVGIIAHISKETRPSPSEQYPSGVVVEQSLEAGTQLPVGTDKEIILYLTE